MDRTACIDLPAFPLQLLLRRHPDWRTHPAAVVDSDRPQGTILWANERARSNRILPGMRYAAGLSLAGDLRAAEVPPEEIRRAISRLTVRLRDHTPFVEPAMEDPGVFWLNASGLERLHDSLAVWAGGIRAELRRMGYHSNAVVGFSRFGTYALAKATRNLLVLDHPDDERAAVRRVPLDRLAIEPEVRDALHKLGVRRIGQFLDLPPEGIARRFGPETHRLYLFASGDRHHPIQPRPPRPPAARRLILDHAETDLPRILVGLEGLLGALLEQLAHEGHVLTRLRLRLSLEDHEQQVENLRPAEPTLDAGQLLSLIRLRLEASPPPDAVLEMVLAAESTPATSRQLQLFEGRPRRDRAAADRALARLRAELGEGAVVRPRLRDGHLPEARFRWEVADRVAEARPRPVDGTTLVRRMFGRPVPLPPRGRNEPDGWMLRGLSHGPVVRMLGPYVVSGGWWNRALHRDYHFVETQKGEILWIYYDRARRRWFLQGRVE